MKTLVTAGNTHVLIDQVRCITNIFTGRTGASIALAAAERGHDVTLLTSHPEVVARHPALRVESYRTFDDLQALMERRIGADNLDCIIHCAAVSDYRSAGIFAPAESTHFDPTQAVWHGEGGPPTLIDRSAGKVKSNEPELWLRLVRTPKLVDRIRRDWRYRGLLVKFKLEVGISDDDLLRIAEQSRLQSAADLLVANTLEGARDWALIGPLLPLSPVPLPPGASGGGAGAGSYLRVDRAQLATRLLAEIDSLHHRRQHG